MSGLSASVLDRAVGTVARRTSKPLNRRSMLRRTTMAATALVAAPADFLLRPNTAYAAVCRCVGQACPCGSVCCDGYTEFCCTLTGSNGCPPGSVAAGWWKVDGSAYCGGAPRYYIDCNSQCGGCGCGGGVCNGSCSGTPCGCTWADCNNRKTGCVKFRYGQCNQQLPCVGPIVCRVATCSPPWLFDPSCSTSSRTDNTTASHNRPCLEAPFGAFDSLTDVGGAIRLTGWAIDQNLQDGVEIGVFVDQAPAVVGMANLSRADVAAAYPYFGDQHGFDITIPASPGRHVVCVMSYDQGSRTSSFLTFAAIGVSGPLGNLDSVVDAPGHGARVVGWVIDPVAAGTPAKVRVSLDGAAVHEAPTDQPRPDVVVGQPTFNGTSGFDVVVDATPGTHQACVDLVYDSGRTARVACQEVVVS